MLTFVPPAIAFLREEADYDAVGDYGNAKYEKVTILIIQRLSLADGVRTAEQAGDDYGFR